MSKENKKLMENIQDLTSKARKQHRKYNDDNYNPIDEARFLTSLFMS